MPIYAYRCSNCGHEQDVLQKMSDAPLTQCPACGQSTYAKQVTAAGFQLKGSGWYVTDFRNNGSKSSGSASKDAAAPASSSAASGSADTGSGGASATTPAATTATTTTTTTTST